MTPYRRYSTVKQMSISLAAFVVLILLLESGGLYDWAQRLDLGPERTVALPTFTLLHRALSPLMIEKERELALVTLARVGWSDDPAALAAANPVLPLPPAAVPPAPAVDPAIKLNTVAVAVAPRPKPTLLQRDSPPTSNILPPIPAIDAGGTRTVALAGDSMMAVGLSSAMLRQAPRYKDLAFLNLFKSGTGLARPDVFNWQLEYPAMLKEAHPDFIVVAIGANDGQGFVEDGVVYPFGSAGWQRIYQQRVEAYLRMIEAHGATVVWLGLPPMKDDTLDARMESINRIDYRVVSASPHAIWFSTAAVVGDGSGHFRDFGEVRGRTERLRQSDGIHLSDDGASLIVEKLLPWLAASAPSAEVSAK
jgi:hypothetical protein